MKDYIVTFRYDGRVTVRVSAEDVDTAINMARDKYNDNVETYNDDKENIVLANEYKGFIIGEVE